MFTLLNSFYLYSLADKEHDKIPEESFLLEYEMPKFGMEFNSVETAHEFYNRNGA
jgi:hypothetical protein